MISVIIATKNGEKYLERAVRSVDNQTEKLIEIIIISDGSIDNTVKIAHSLADKNPAIKVIKLEESIGPGLARDKGIREAKGEYIALLDDDDMWLDPNKLRVQRSFLAENSDYSVVGASLIELLYEDNSSKIFRTKKEDAELRRNALWRNPFVTSSLMFRKKDYLEVGGFSSMRQAEDYDLGLKLLKIGKGRNLDQCDIRYYVRKSGAHRINKQSMNYAILELVEKHSRDFPNYLLGLIKAYGRILLGFINV